MPRLALTRSFSPLSRRCAVPLLLGQTNVSSRTLSSYASSFVDLACSSASKHQLYLSSCDDPFVNLSIEHYLLEKSPPDSIVLLFYVNRPCIVIGRNQNPWLEVNLSLLRQNDIQQPIALVRRRSGGGTVFHDYGNVNVSLIRPPSAFTRNALLEIIVHAIRPREPRVTINERHDIVLQPFAGEDGVTRKVSGSAYKLTRHRALHHATCLVDSPNLERISAFLRSSGRGYIKARGVDSVRSPVGNLFPGSGDQGVNAFIRQVTDAFAQERHLGDGWREQLVNRSDKVFLDSSAGVVYGVLGEELAEVDRIKDGIEQLKVWQEAMSLLQLITDYIDDRTRHGYTGKRPNSPSKRIRTN